MHLLCFKLFIAYWSVHFYYQHELFFTLKYLTLCMHFEYRLMHHASLTLIFLEYTQASKLGRGLIVFSMTID